MDMVEKCMGCLRCCSFRYTILLSLFWKRFNYQGAVAGVISGFVIDLGWLLAGVTRFHGYL
ncbi:MAG: sodium:solute symporter family transporter [Lachnospiraceae bacterium]